MASQSEILQFFEMMTERAKRGEFRFIIVGSVNYETDDCKVTIAGLATESEAAKLAGIINSQVDQLCGDDND